VFLLFLLEEEAEEWSAQLAAFHGSNSIIVDGVFPSLLLSSAATYTLRGFESPAR